MFVWITTRTLAILFVQTHLIYYAYCLVLKEIAYPLAEPDALPFLFVATVAGSGSGMSKSAGNMCRTSIALLLMAGYTPPLL